MEHNMQQEPFGLANCREALLHSVQNVDKYIRSSDAMDTASVMFNVVTEGVRLRLFRNQICLQIYPWLLLSVL